MFDTKHYVPILRWKRGEKFALRYLDSQQKSNITPLLELIPSNYQSYKYLRDIKASSEVIVNEINDYWGSDNIFLDFQHLSLHKISNLDALALREISKKAENLNLNIIPVTNLLFPTPYLKVTKKLIKQNKSGVCVRIRYHSILQTGFQKNIDQLLDYLDVNPSECNLIIDYGIIDNDQDILPNIYDRIPNIESWKTLTFTSGAFPQYLDRFTPGQHKLNRDDWNFWYNNMLESKYERVPTFSDYTIQHPIYSEPGVGFNVSASIRYTSDSYWVIMRGEGLNNDGGPGHAQYPANAQLLMNRSEYCGSTFSYGDKYIYEKGSNLNNSTGNPETWLRAGINHHIAFVVMQLSNLNDS